MTLVSMSAFGEMHGSSKQAVSKWKAKGALKIVDGKIDVEASDRLMLHHGLGRFAEPSTRPSTVNQIVNRQPTTTPPPSTGLAQEISDLAADVGDEFANLPGLQRFVAVIAAGGYSNAVEAETVKQNALALKHLLDARVKANELCDIADAERVAAHFGACAMPVTLHDAGVTADGATLVDHMRHDKKMAGGTLPFLLTRGIGQTFVCHDVDLDDVARFLDEEHRTTR